MAWGAMSGHSATCVMQAACDSGLACPKPPAEECMVSEWQEVSSHLLHGLPKHTPCNIQHTLRNMHHAAYILASPIEAPPRHCPLLIIIRPCLSLAATAAGWQWSECTTSCGGGVRSRQRLLLSTSATRFGLGGADYTG
jgi:hypothetical protein